MSGNSRRRALSILPLCFAMLGGCVAGSPDEGDSKDESVQGSQERSVDGIAINNIDGRGVANFVTGSIGQVSLEEGQSAAEVEAAMLPIFRKVAPLFRLMPEEMVLARRNADKEGDKHFHFQQYKNGLKVLGAEVAVHVRDGVVIGVNGDARGDHEAPIDAKVDADAAISLVRGASADVQDLVIGELPELAYRPAGEALDLVYLVDVTGAERDTMPIHDTVVVSAMDGSILDRISHIHTAKSRELHDLAHGWSLPGDTVRTEGGAAVADAVVNTSYDHLGTVYDCYKNLFGRDSYNNQGAKLVSSVHYGTNVSNASWTGTQMLYGDGDGVTMSNFANSLDITGHELTHAVTGATSNLIYAGESGGLNEAWSDALGNVCEWYGAGQPASPATGSFLVGETIFTPSIANDAIRYMCDPAADGASLDYWTSSAGNADVHDSSGIANLAFCLLVKGGSHPRGKSTATVAGIGMTKAAQIWYKAELLMTSSTDFAGAKTATEQAASQLGYSYSEIASVSAAWQAVGVGRGLKGSWTMSGGPSSTSAANPRFRLHLNQTSTVQLDLTSSKDTYLSLLSAGGSVIAQNDDSGNTKNSRLSMSLNAGDYLLVAGTHSSNEIGDFVIKSDKGVLSALAQGAWSPSGGQTIASPANPKFVLDIKEPSAVELSLKSFYTDTVLFLLDQSGALLGSNDDSGGNTNSSLAMSLNTGRYVVVAGTFANGASGSFDLTSSHGVLRSAPSSFTRVNGDGAQACPGGYFLASRADVTSRRSLAEAQLNTWDIARLTEGWALRGASYGYDFKYEVVPLGNTLCGQR